MDRVEMILLRLARGQDIPGEMLDDLTLQEIMIVIVWVAADAIAKAIIHDRNSRNGNGHRPMDGQPVRRLA
jgi:hypothetical protein